MEWDKRYKPKAKANKRSDAKKVAEKKNNGREAGSSPAAAKSVSINTPERKRMNVGEENNRQAREQRLE